MSRDRVWGECGRSGRRVLLKDMVRDGQNYELLVAADEYDPWHPQLEASPIRDSDMESRVRFPAPEVVRLTGPVLTAEAGYGEGDDPQAELSWTEGYTPGLWKEYRLYRSVDGGDAELVITNEIERDWDASILTDIREHFDGGRDVLVPVSYYVIAVDQNDYASQSNTVTINPEDWPELP